MFIHLGGSLGREKRRTRRFRSRAGSRVSRANIAVASARVAVQGFGNRRQRSRARSFAGAGARVVAIQDHTATPFNATGIDMKVPHGMAGDRTQNR